MNIFTVLSYLNKISLFAFFITAGFLFYQVYLLKKTSPPKEEKPNIPDFNENMKIDVENYTKLPGAIANPTPIPIKKENKTVLFILAGLGGLTIILFIIISLKSTPSTPSPQVSVQITLTPSPTFKPKPILSVSPTATAQAELQPTLTPTTTPVPPTVEPSEAPSPTEVILAKISPTEALTTGTPTPSSMVSPTTSLTATVTTGASISPTTISSLPTTGVIDRGLAIFAVASLLIFFSFVF